MHASGGVLLLPLEESSYPVFPDRKCCHLHRSISARDVESEAKWVVNSPFFGVYSWWLEYAALKHRLSCAKPQHYVLRSTWGSEFFLSAVGESTPAASILAAGAGEYMQLWSIDEPQHNYCHVYILYREEILQKLTGKWVVLWGFGVQCWCFILTVHNSYAHSYLRLPQSAPSTPNPSSHPPRTQIFKAFARMPGREGDSEGAPVFLRR